MATFRDYTQVVSTYMAHSFRHQLSNETGVGYVSLPNTPVEIYNVNDQCRRLTDALVQAYLRPGSSQTMNNAQR